jgi:inner membrane protein
MGRSGFNRKTALATVTMVLAAEAADVDVLWSFKGSIAGLQHHRGITHSFVGAPFVAAATLGFVYLYWRWHDRVPRKSKRPALDAQGNPLPVRWGYLYFLALLAALSHLLLDYTTAYGIRLLEPFNYRWYSWDIVYIVEPLMLLALVAGLAMPAIFRLVNEEIGAHTKGPHGRVGAIFALVCLVVIWGVRDYQHRHAVTTLDAVTYRGEQPLRVAAYPYWVNPFRWHGVVETHNFFETVPVNSLQSDEDLESGALTFFKPEETPASLAAKSSYMGRVYLDWAAFPYVTVEPLHGSTPGYLAEFQDLRYSYPGTSGRRSPLTGFVLLGPDLRVLDEGMNTSRSPTIESLEQEGIRH